MPHSVNLFQVPISEHAGYNAKLNTRTIIRRDVESSYAGPKDIRIHVEESLVRSPEMRE